MYNTIILNRCKVGHWRSIKIGYDDNAFAKDDLKQNGTTILTCVIWLVG